MRCFFDTNVVVYAYDLAESRKRERAMTLMERHCAADTLVVSTQVLIESYNSLQRAALLSSEAALETVQALADEHVVTTDTSLVLRALRLSQQQRISHWDALVVQAALDAGCGVLFTEDLQAGRKFGDLEVVNPFADTAHETRTPYLARTPAKPVKRKRPK